MKNSIFSEISKLFATPTAKSNSPAENPHYDTKSFYILGIDRERSRSTENILRRIVAETGQNTKIYIQH
jgi:hypothetical protein